MTEKTTVNWQASAHALRQRIAKQGLQPQVHALLKRADGGRVLVACSGGADSTFMLCVMFSYASELGLDLVVAHYNHRWRGPESDEDAKFVERIAASLSCRYIAEIRPEKEAAFTETTARALRLDFLRRAAVQADCRWIAFGHQLDDILETQLQRLARGSGTDGMAAPRPIARFGGLPTHVRPLLHLRSGDIHMALNTCGVPWREDRSNQNLNIARNALRRRVIPDLYDVLGRDPSFGAARSRRLFEEDAAALDSLAKEMLPRAYAGKSKLDRAPLRALPRGITRRAMTAWLSANELIESVSAPMMDLLLDAIYSQRKRHRMSVGMHYIIMESGHLLLEPYDPDALVLATEVALLEPGASVLLSTGAVMDSEMLELDEILVAEILSGGINPAHEAYIEMKQGAIYEVRPWQPGDRFRPIGAPGTKKLKDWFIDRHIPVRERKQLPVVTNNRGEIIWVPGFPPADALKIRRGMKRALRLTYRTRNPI